MSPRRRSPAAGSAAAGAPQERDSDRQRESGKERERQGEIRTTKCDLTLLVRSHLGSDVACQIAADQLMRSFRRFRCLAAFSFFPYCPDRPWQMKFRRELTVGIPTEPYLKVSHFARSLAWGMRTRRGLQARDPRGEMSAPVWCPQGSVRTDGTCRNTFPEESKSL